MERRRMSDSVEEGASRPVAEEEEEEEEEVERW